MNPPLKILFKKPLTRRSRNQKSYKLCTSAEFLRQTPQASASALEQAWGIAPFTPYASSPARFWVRADADATEQQGLNRPR